MVDKALPELMRTMALGYFGASTGAAAALVAAAAPILPGARSAR
jgi:hypothetical protein